MRLTILGSGTNIHPTRAAAGYLVQTDQTLLFDFGPRTLANLIKTGTDRHRITHILFSHFHADHFSDFVTFFFDAVYVSKFAQARPDLTLIGPRGTKRLFGTILRAFPGFKTAPFRVRLREVADRSFSLGATRIVPRTVQHSSHLHCIGYRIEHNGKALAYSGDAQYCENLVRLCRRADVAVLDCSFPANRPGSGHMHAGDCGRVAQEAGVRRLILSHFYPIAERYDVKAQAGRLFAGRITIGRDLMEIDV
ncbi:MAG: MBL fold metallo-hydrolase [Nitrospira sp.]|nr:MBL fold metallo-hydrolase [Nitrospira sp.]